MKLVTYSPLPSGDPRPGLVVEGRRIVDIPAAPAAPMPTPPRCSASSAAGAPMLRPAARAGGASPPCGCLALDDVKLHAPIPRPAKNVFCVGWNYLEHFEEGAKKLQDNRELPKWPVFFSKAVTAVTGPFDTVPFDAADLHLPRLGSGAGRGHRHGRQEHRRGRRDAPRVRATRS